MKKRNITIHDIARELNITASTVSRALNNHPRISKSTKKAVLEMADKLKYQPNALASNLRRGKGKTIGVIVPRINRHFFANVIGGIEEVATREGFRVMICQSYELYEKEVENVRALLNAQVDGIIMSLSSTTIKFDHLYQIIDRDIPLLFFDRTADTINTSSVVVNNYQGSYEIVKEMILRGCKRIIHLAGPLHLHIYSERNNGFKKALSELKVNNVDELVFPDILTQEEGRNQMSTLINKGIKFDGIFASSDFSALGAYLVLKENGVSIPDEVSIAGFANERFTSLMSPPISSVEQHSEKIGEIVAELFLKHYLAKGALKPEKIILEPDILIRESIKKTLINKNQ